MATAKKGTNNATKVTGTIAAFENLLSIRGVYKHLEVDKSTVSAWREYLKNKKSDNGGKGITIEKMEEILQRYGATVISEKVWSIPEPKK